MLATVAAPTDFSGTWVLQTADPGKAGSPLGLKMLQTAAILTVTDDSAGKVTTNTFKMDGSNSPYTTPTGFSGVCSVKWDGKALTLQTLVEGKKPDQSVIHILKKERMELSEDKQTLKVHTVILSPDFPAGLFTPFDSVYKHSKQTKP